MKTESETYCCNFCLRQSSWKGNSDHFFCPLCSTICASDPPFEHSRIRSNELIGTFGDKNVERKRCTNDVNLTWFESAYWTSTSICTSNWRHTQSVCVLRSCHQRIIVPSKGECRSSRLLRDDFTACVWIYTIKAAQKMVWRTVPPCYLHQTIISETRINLRDTISY